MGTVQAELPLLVDFANLDSPFIIQLKKLQDKNEDEVLRRTLR